MDGRADEHCAIGPDSWSMNIFGVEFPHRFAYGPVMKIQIEPFLETSAQALLGTWRRFGISGPVYEIIAIGRPLSTDDQLMRVKVVESGEELDYRLREILEDPRED